MLNKLLNDVLLFAKCYRNQKKRQFPPHLTWVKIRGGEAKMESGHTFLRNFFCNPSLMLLNQMFVQTVCANAETIKAAKVYPCHLWPGEEGAIIETIIIAIS